MLKLKLSNSSLSQDGTELTLQDTTGAYNAGSNPGGYGAPNVTPAAAVVALLRYFVYGNKPKTIVVDKNEMVTGKVITPLFLELTTDDTKPYLIPDGVNVFEYLLGYTYGVASVTDKVIDVTGLTLPPLKYVSFSSNNMGVYEVVQQTITSLVLKEIPEFEPGATLIGFYNAESYVLVDTYIQKTIDQKVIALEACDDSFELMDDVLNLTAAASRFSVQDYLGANTLITTLNRRYSHGRYRVQY